MIKSLTSRLLTRLYRRSSIHLNSLTLCHIRPKLVRRMASTASGVNVFDEYYNFALKLAAEGGKVARAALTQKDKRTFEEKSCSSDVVTETDYEVEKLLFDQIRKVYPSHSLIGEESASVADTGCEFTSSPTWIIDPIDGTSNFVHGFPFVAISIGLWVDKKPAVGVIYNIMLDNLYAACRGKGATLNGQKICSSGQTELDKAFILCEWGSERMIERVSTVRDNMYSLAMAPNPCHGLRSLGSSALNMCMVASGCADTYIEVGLHCWDMAAGVLIAEEAGAVCMDIEGGELDLMSRRLICSSTPALAEQVIKKYKPLSPKRDD